MRRAWLCLAALVLAGCEPAPPAGSRLAQLATTAQAYHIAGVNNLSGITWHAGRRSLFVISNRPTVMAEVTPRGELLRVIPLEGFEDTEDIAWLGGNRFAVLEERRSRISLFRLPDGAKRVAHHHARVLPLPPVGAAGEDNKGYEALAYAAASDTLYVGNESGPQHILALHGLRQDAPGPWQPVAFEPRGDGDVAGLHADAASGHLLVLNERARRLNEIRHDGTRIAGRRLGGPWWGARHPEGLALDDQGTLYVVGEPDTLHVFAPVAHP